MRISDGFDQLTNYGSKIIILFFDGVIEGVEGQTHGLAVVVAHFGNGSGQLFDSNTAVSDARDQQFSNAIQIIAQLGEGSDQRRFDRLDTVAIFVFVFLFLVFQFGVECVGHDVRAFFNSVKQRCDFIRAGVERIEVVSVTHQQANDCRQLVAIGIVHNFGNVAQIERRIDRHVFEQVNHLSCAVCQNFGQARSLFARQVLISAVDQQQRQNRPALTSIGFGVLRFFFFGSANFFLFVLVIFISDHGSNRSGSGGGSRSSVRSSVGNRSSVGVFHQLTQLNETSGDGFGIGFNFWQQCAILFIHPVHNRSELHVTLDAGRSSEQLGNFRQVRGNDFDGRIHFLTYAHQFGQVGHGFRFLLFDVVLIIYRIQ